MLVIRGELLKRYPNTVIYAQKAIDDGQGNRMIFEKDLTPEQFDRQLKFPLFRAEIEPDLRFFGFDLTIDKRGARSRATTFKNDTLGWFFVIQEVPGEPRFGMDIRYDADAGQRRRPDQRPARHLEQPRVEFLRRRRAAFRHAHAAAAISDRPDAAEMSKHQLGLECGADGLHPVPDACDGGGARQRDARREPVMSGPNMPDFNEQLDTIARLRAEARQHEEALYDARVASAARPSNSSGARERGQTVPAADRDARSGASASADGAAQRTARRRCAKKQREIAQQLEEIAEQRRAARASHARASRLDARTRGDARGASSRSCSSRILAPQDEIDRLAAELDDARAVARRSSRKRSAMASRTARTRCGRERRAAASARKLCAAAWKACARTCEGLQERIGELLQPAFDDR